MKAIRVSDFGGPEVLKVEQVADLQPGPGQVVVRNRAVGVNPVEAYIRTGKYPSLPKLPYTPGTDSAGDVAAVGDGVDHIKVGDRVYVYGSASGTYAEISLSEAWQVHPLPDRASYDQGAVGVSAGAAWRALFPRGKAAAGETVLIHGATGAVGVSAVQFARAAGLTVIGTYGKESAKQRLLDAGAHYAAHHDAWEEIKSLGPGGKGVPLIIEMRADQNLEGDLKILSPRGRVVVVGSRGQTEIDPRLTMGPELDIRGISLPNMTREENIAMNRAIVAALESGVLQPIIGPIFGLAEAPLAHEAVMSGDTQGKIILRPSG